jgi:hypothetical protein
MIKIFFHSVVDLITNSSTTIFTYSEGALGSVKDLINEMLKVFGVTDKTADDLFYLGVFSDRYEDFIDYFDDEDEISALGFPYKDKGYKEIRELIYADIIKVLKGEMEKPQWMIEFENYEGYSDPG